MNKRKMKIATILVLLVLLSGCTKTLKDDENKIVKYDSEILCSTCERNCSTIIEEYNLLKEKETLTEEEQIRIDEIEGNATTCEATCKEECDSVSKSATGQALTQNILCQPKNEEVIEIYKLYNVDIDKLPSCDNYRINEGSYEGLWTSFFVKPLAWLLLKVGTIFKNYGLSLVIIGFLIRLLMMPLTKSTALQSENMKKAQPEIALIEAKYKEKTDQDSVMKKNQETMALYKKYNINPLSSCLFALVQIPILFAFIEAINRVPAIFEGSFLGLKLGLTPTVAILRGEWWYISIVIILALVTYFSFNLNKTAAPVGDSQKQMKIMNKFLIVFIIFMSFSLSTAIGIYWITSSSFTIFQNLIVKRSGKK